MEKKNFNESLEAVSAGNLQNNLSSVLVKNLMAVTALSLAGACSSAVYIEDAEGGKAGQSNQGGVAGKGNVGGLAGKENQGGVAGDTASGGSGLLSGAAGVNGGNGGLDGGTGGIGGMTAGSGNGGSGSIEECMKPYDPATVADHPVSFDVYTGNTDRVLSLCVTAALDKDGVSPYKECFERKTVITVDLTDRQCPCTFNLVADGQIPINIVTYVFRNAGGSTTENNIYYNSAIDEKSLTGLAQQNAISSDVYSSIYGTFINEQIRCHQSLPPVPTNCAATAPTFTTRSDIFGLTTEAVYQRPITEGVSKTGSVFYGFIRKPCQ